MNNYYFLSSFLSPQQPESPPIYSFQEINDLLALNFTEQDWKSYVILRRFFDLENFAFFWAGKSIPFSFGTVTNNNVETLLRLQMWSDEWEFEDFFKDFLLRYKTSQERLLSFSELVSGFLDHYQNYPSEFLRTYFRFKQDLRIILAGFRARVMQKDVSFVLRDEDSSNPVVLHVLMQKDSPNYELPDEFFELKDVLGDYGRLPHMLNQTLSLYEFHKVEEMSRDKYFNTDAILSRVTAYLMAIRNSWASVQKGKELIDLMEKGIRW